MSNPTLAGVSDFAADNPALFTVARTGLIALMLPVDNVVIGAMTAGVGFVPTTLGDVAIFLSLGVAGEMAAISRGEIPGPANYVPRRERRAKAAEAPGDAAEWRPRHSRDVRESELPNRSQDRGANERRPQITRRPNTKGGPERGL